MISNIFILIGSIFVLIAGLGVVRMPDLLMRMHAATKAGTSGATFVLTGVAIKFSNTPVTAKAIITIIFIAITAPIAAHLIARAAYFNKIPLWKNTRIDELKEHYDSWSHKLESSDEENK